MWYYTIIDTLGFLNPWLTTELCELDLVLNFKLNCLKHDYGYSIPINLKY